MLSDEDRELRVNLTRELSRYKVQLEEIQTWVEYLQGKIKEIDDKEQEGA